MPIGPAKPCCVWVALHFLASQVDEHLAGNWAQEGDLMPGQGTHLGMTLQACSGIISPLVPPSVAQLICWEAVREISTKNTKRKQGHVALKLFITRGDPVVSPTMSGGPERVAPN